MTLPQRVKRLELVQRGDACPVCRAQGLYKVSHVHDDEPIPTVAGCPACGEVHHVVVRHVVKPLLREAC